MLGTRSTGGAFLPFSMSAALGAPGNGTQAPTPARSSTIRIAGCHGRFIVEAGVSVSLFVMFAIPFRRKDYPFRAQTHRQR
jgi:hypothetical protein